MPLPVSVSRFLPLPSSCTHRQPFCLTPTSWGTCLFPILEARTVHRADQSPVCSLSLRPAQYKGLTIQLGHCLHVCPSTTQSACKRVSQSGNRSVSLSTGQIACQLRQPVNRSVSLSTGQSACQQLSLSTSQSACQQLSLSTGQSACQQLSQPRPKPNKAEIQHTNIERCVELRGGC